MKRWVLIGLFLLFPVLVSCGNSGTSSNSSEYSTVPVTRGDLTSLVTATGSLSPLVTVQVGSQISGTIEDLYVDFNEPVKKGQLIALVEQSLFKARVAQEEANLKRAEASLRKAELAVEEAKRNLDRSVRLHEQSLVAEGDLDTGTFAWKTAIVEKNLREAEVTQTAAALQYARVNLMYTSVYAPIDGIVISRDVEVGQTVAASLQAPTLFLIAQDLTRMRIEVDVDEAFIGMLKEGQDALFSVFAYPGEIFRGNLSQVRLNPSVEGGVVKYKCIVHVSNPDNKLKPGMTATVSIEVGKRENVLKVPSAALRFIPTVPEEQLSQVRKRLRKGESVVWVQDGEELRPVTVETGLVGENETEISGEGISEGTVIAIPLSAKKEEKRRSRRMRLF